MKVRDEMKSESKLKSYREVTFKITASEETAVAMAIYDRLKRLDLLIANETSDRIKVALIDDRNTLASILHDLNYN